MTMTNDDAVAAFASGATDGGAGNLWTRGDTLYSYGKHFPVALRRTARNGRALTWGAGVAYLINGDSYSVSTTRHTNLAIWKLRPQVQIPFSALRRVVAENPAYNRFQLSSNPVYNRFQLSSTRYNEEAIRQIRILDVREDSYGWSCSECGAEISGGYNSASDQSLHSECITKRAKAIVAGNTLDTPPTVNAIVQMLQVSWHIMGAVLFEYRGTCWLSSLDANERRPHYFLCELPKIVSTIEAAHESLKPEVVKRAESLGMKVKRQGDVFFIPLPHKLTAELPIPTFKKEPVSRDYDPAAPTNEYAARRFRLEGLRYYEDSRHIASQLRARCLDTFVRGVIRHPEHRTLSLGKVWHLVVKNLAGRAFSAAGAVD